MQQANQVRVAVSYGPELFRDWRTFSQQDWAKNGANHQISFLEF